MFSDSGKKVKNLATVVFVLCIIIGVIITIALYSILEVISLLFIPVFVLVGWVNSILLYAFGDLCDNVQKIASGRSDGDSKYNIDKAIKKATKNNVNKSEEKQEDEEEYEEGSELKGFGDGVYL